MSHIYKTEGVHEFKDTGIILMKNSGRFLAKWSLLFTSGKQEIIVFSDIHYMKHTTDGILLVTSTIDAIKSYTIRYEDHNLQVSSLDLYEWILSILCLSPELPSVT